MTFKDKINSISRLKKSTLVLAIDPSGEISDLFAYVCEVISNMSDYICAIKLNFHVVLPLSRNELQKITALAHDKNILVIADIKLNDIFNTNQITIKHLSSMGFDCVIVNPFIGKSNLKSTLEFAHSLDCGIICLVYMSHESAKEGYGALTVTKIEDQSNTGIKPFYQIFYDIAVLLQADGIVVGGNRLEILHKLSGLNNIIPIFSPGLITQGGDVRKAIEAGSDYLIIGRHILDSRNPVDELKYLYNIMKEYIK